MGRDDAIEIVKVKEKRRGVTSTQYYCPSCKSLLPKSSYTRAKKPQYCQECGQKLKYSSRKEELINLTLNDTQKALLTRVDNLLEGKEI